MTSRSLLIIILAIATFASAADSPSIATHADIGSWRIARTIYVVQDFVSDEALTEKQAGQRLARQVATITMHGPKACSPHRYVHTSQRTGLLAGNKIPTETTLGLPEQVVVFEYDCFELWLRSDNSAVAGVNGYYFELKKVR